MATSDEINIRKAYKAFNRRDIDAVLRFMHSDVHWPNGWEGGYVEGHDEVRAYWTRQWQELDPHVTSVSFREMEEGQLEVDVCQLVKNKEGAIVFNGMVIHSYTIENGMIRSMEIKQAEG